MQQEKSIAIQRIVKNEKLHSVHRNNGFTLIELLVVITIIALLVSILVPTLNKAKEQAKMIVCMSNHQNLQKAWMMYNMDNSGKVVDSNVKTNGTLEDDLKSWSEPPVSGKPGSSIYKGNNATLEYEQNGIRYGAIYKYIKDVELYHCPSCDCDRYNVTPLYRSYSIVGTLNGEESDQDISVKNEGRIKRPTEKFVFMDECDNRGWNMGSWLLDYQGKRFNDPISYWHPRKNVFSYADGHADYYEWKDKRTVQFAQCKVGLAENISSNNASAGNEDVEFLMRGYKMN